MDRTEFFRRQAERFSKLARECIDAKISAKLQVIADEYRAMLDGKATDGEQERRVKPAE
jgi:hypothetical protein